MEAASKKIGRPKVIPEDMRWLIESAATPGCTERSRQDTYYRLHAMATLGEVSGCEWVMPSKDEPSKWKPSILTELGRLLMVDDDGAIAVARTICEAKPSTKRAIAIIRKARTGKVVVPTVDAIEDALNLAMDNYRDTHSGTTLAQLREALNKACRIVEWMIEEEGS